MAYAEIDLFASRLLDHHMQLLDRSGLLYGELARFVFRLLGIRTKPKRGHPPVSRNLQGAENSIEGPKAAPTGAWDGVWRDGI